MREDIKTKDGTIRSVRKSTIKNESCSRMTEASNQSSNPVPSSNTLPNIDNLKSITNNAENSLALANSTPFAHSNRDVMKIDEVVQNRMSQTNGVTYVEKTVTTTTVTTTVEKLIMHSDASTNSTFHTPLKGVYI